MMRQSWLFYLSSWFWPQTQVFVLLKKQTLVFVFLIKQTQVFILLKKQTWLDAVKHEASLKHRMDSSAKWQTCFCWFASFSEITLLQFGVRAASYQRSVIATPSVWQRQARLRARARWLRTYEAASSSSSNIQSVVGYFLRGFYFWFLYFSVFLWSRLLCARVVSCLTLLSLWLLLSFEFSVLLSDCFHPFVIFGRLFLFPFVGIFAKVKLGLFFTPSSEFVFLGPNLSLHARLLLCLMFSHYCRTKMMLPPGFSRFTLWLESVSSVSAG